LPSCGWSLQLYPAQYIEHTPNNGKRNYLHYMDGPYVAGNYEFDPLSLYESLGDDASGRRAMRELEVGDIILAGARGGQCGLVLQYAGGRVLIARLLSFF